MFKRLAALLSCLAIAGCAHKPLAIGADGKYQVTAKCSPATLTATIRDAIDATLVVAIHPCEPDILAAVSAAKRPSRPVVVTIGAAPNDQEEIADAVIVAETGAAAAIDLALIACNGIPVSANELEIGTRTITSANRAAGGSVRVAPGDAIMAMIRMQHSAVLTTTPETDVMHLVGMLQTDASTSWQKQVRATIATAAARYPQLQLVSGDDSVDHVKQATAMIQQGCRALVVATSDPAKTHAIVAAAALAPDGAVPVIVLDPTLQKHGTCVIGCSARSLGLAAATMVHQLLPEGGAMIACIGNPGDADAEASRHLVRGFCDAMGLPSERLLGR